MGWMGKVVKGVGMLAGVLALVSVGAYAWATAGRDAVLSKTWEVPTADFPIPFPLDEAEIAALRAERLAAMPPLAAVDGAAPPAEVAAPDPLAGVDLDAIALERAVARGKHLMFSRLGCPECHGDDLAGGVMIDAPAMGRLRGPNITSGGVTKGWGAADWDRIVRHGVMSDGRTSIMPSQDFQSLSDRELSDVIAYARSVAPSDNVEPPPAYGPVMTMLLAFEQVQPGAYLMDHSKKAPRVPPPAGVDARYGEHLAESCRGCHGMKMAGGPIAGGDPSWPPAANLTPKATAGWTWEGFDKALRGGVRQDGKPVLAPMPTKFYKNLSEEESRAIWTYLQSIPAAETGDNG